MDKKFFTKDGREIVRYAVTEKEQLFYLTTALGKFKEYYKIEGGVPNLNTISRIIEDAMWSSFYYGFKEGILAERLDREGKIDKNGYEKTKA
jgi:hypothetical protein